MFVSKNESVEFITVLGYQNVDFYHIILKIIPRTLKHMHVCRLSYLLIKVIWKAVTTGHFLRGRLHNGVKSENKNNI